MKLKKLNGNGVACAITAAMILIAFVVGGTRPLNRLRIKAADVYYSGTESYGPNSFNIADDLKEYAGMASNTLTVAKRYMDESTTAYAELNIARQELLDVTEKAAEAGSALVKVRNANEKLKEILLTDFARQLSDKDAKDLNIISDNMKSKHTIISREAEMYDEYAKDFNAKLSRLPASFFKTAKLVKALPLFYDIL